jgi:hypothetical protein
MDPITIGLIVANLLSGILHTLQAKKSHTIKKEHDALVSKHEKLAKRVR